MRAKYSYRSGNVLLLPKEGQASMLFLEFIRDYSKEQRAAGIKTPLTFTIKDAGEFNGTEADYFYIRMENQLRATFADAVSYINENLPIEA